MKIKFKNVYISGCGGMLGEAFYEITDGNHRYELAQLAGIAAGTVLNFVLSKTLVFSAGFGETEG